MFPSLALVAQCILLTLISSIHNSLADIPLSAPISSPPPASNVMKPKVACSELPNSIVECKYNNTTSCIYGDLVRVACVPVVGVKCANEDKPHGEVVAKSNRSKEWWNRGGHYRMAICRFCHQIEGGFGSEVVTCDAPVRDCSQPGVARSFYMSTCRVGVGVICMGKRQFYRMRPCHRPSNKHYGSTVTLSLFLGGLGADRFYLGMWREGLGKLFTFGGLGVWSLLDFILVTIGYICPQDDLIYWHDP